MAEIEIGVYKSGRQAYGLDDIAIVPSRRTRDPEDVDISWEIDAYRFELPLLGSAMDGVMSPATAIELGQLGGLGVLNLEGLWTRYEDPTNLFDEIRELDDEKATARMQQMYSEPIKPELVTARIRQMKEAGITTAASVTPQRTESLAPACLAAELDILVIQGTVVVGRTRVEDGGAPQPQAFHPGVRPPGHRRRLRLLPGRAPPHAHRRRRGPRRRRSGQCLHHPGRARSGRARRPPPSPTWPGRACATWTRRASTSTSSPTAGMSKGGDIAKAIACGADAVMLGSPLSSAFEAPARGFHWGMATFHPDPPRGARVRTSVRGSLREILLGPAHENDGRMNLFGALRTAMATCGYETVKEFQKAEVMVAPSLQTEGKFFQRTQGVGMGH